MLEWNSRPDRSRTPLVALIAGILILIFPRILNYVVAHLPDHRRPAWALPEPARVNGFPGLRVGHAADAALKSGVTVFLPDEPAIAAVHVAGGAPASRETDLLRPGNLVERVDAIVLLRRLGVRTFRGRRGDGMARRAGPRLRGRRRARADRSRRLAVRPAEWRRQIAPVAPLAAPSIYRALGIAACEDAGPCRELGSVGAGTGATTADLKGGFGAAATVLADGSAVAACVAVNSVGRVTLGTTPHFRAAPFETDREFGGLGLPSPLPPDAGEPIVKQRVAAHANTTLALSPPTAR